MARTPVFGSRHLPSGTSVHALCRSVLRLQTVRTGAQELEIFSDVHFDSPKCHRKHLKQRLDRCLELGIPIILNGDLFDVMGAMRDPRSAKGGVRPEYDKPNYFDLVIEDAIEFMRPYKGLVAGYVQGNHETAILKHQETDPQRRFLLGLGYEPDVMDMLALGYTASISLSCPASDGTPGGIHVANLYFHHGHGGNSPMSGGALTFRRTLMSHHGYDGYIFGHKHIAEALFETVKRVVSGVPTSKNVFGIHVPSLKDTRDEVEGWEIEKGFKPAPVGTCTLHYEGAVIKRSNGRERTVKIRPEMNLACGPA